MQRKLKKKKLKVKNLIKFFHNSSFLSGYYIFYFIIQIIKNKDKNNIIDSVKAGNGTMSNESIDTLIVQISKAINEYSQEASQVALEYSNTNMNRCVNGVMYPKSYKRDFAISFILTIGMFLALTGLYAVRQIPKRETEKYFVETENTEEKTSETDTEED